MAEKSLCDAAFWSELEERAIPEPNDVEPDMIPDWYAALFAMIICAGAASIAVRAVWRFCD